MVVRLSTATLIFHDVNSPMIIQVGPLRHGLLRRESRVKLACAQKAYARSISSDVRATNRRKTTIVRTPEHRDIPQR